MTNFEILRFLVQDADYHNVHSHRQLLRAQFPDEDFTDQRIDNLRTIIIRSKAIVSDSRVVKYRREIKVISVDKSFKNPGGAKKAGEPKITDSYLTSEPPPVVRMIGQVKQFDQLLRDCRGSYV